MAKNELPKSRSLWRVTGHLQRESGEWKPETSALMVLHVAEEAAREWCELGLRNVEIITDEDAVAKWRRETGRDEELKYGF